MEVCSSFSFHLGRLLLIRSRHEQFKSVDNPVWRPYLFDWWGKSYAKRIVFSDRKYWFVKCVPRDPQSAIRERLAYLLGRKFSNIAEVRLLSRLEFEAIQKLVEVLPDGATESNTCLVRVGFDYTWLRLPVKNLEHAVAAELVYSLWIRRRDAHSFNRVYVGDIPIFFDHSTGILGEPELADLDRFFFPGPDAGYAAWWQIEEKRSMQRPNLLLIREREKEIFATGNENGNVFHQVREKDRLHKHLFKVAKHIRGMPRSYFSDVATKVGFEKAESEMIAKFLLNSAHELDRGLKRLCSMFNLPAS